VAELFLQVRVQARDGLLVVSRTVNWDAVPRSGELVLVPIGAGHGGARVQSVVWEDGVGARAQIELEPQTVAARAEDVTRDADRAGWAVRMPDGRQEPA